MKPVVSVITVCYNAAQYLEKTICSVLGQTYSNIEYLVIDGGSTDATKEIVGKYSDRIATFLSEPDKGIYNAMNKGIRLATGQWVIFMNAGDVFYDNDVLASIPFESLSPDVKVIYGDTVKRTDSDEYVKAKPLTTLKRGIHCCHQSMLVSTFDKEYISYNEKYRISADYELAHRLYCDYGTKAFHYVPVAFSIFEAAEGISSKQRIRLFDEQLDIRKDEKNLMWLVDYLRNCLRKLKK